MKSDGRWHVAFTVEIDRPIRTPAPARRVVGVDVGITHLAVLSTGDLIDNPRPLQQTLGRLRRAARRLARRIGPDRRAGRRASRRWQRARAWLARVHARVANLRRNSLHHLTSHLAATFGTIVVEDLHVTGMLRNHRLARHVADAGFGELRRQLAYKTGWAGPLRHGQ